MNIRTIIRNSLRASIALPRLGPRWSSRIAPTSIPLSAVRINTPSNSIRIEPIDLELDTETFWFAEAYDYATALKEIAGAKFTRGNHGEIVVDIGDFKVAAQTSEEIFILHEVLVEGTYDFATPYDAVVWDIGMNIGISALYFATRKKSPVFAYELSPSTFARGAANLAINKPQSVLIEANNVGIGRADEIIAIKVDPSRRGHTSRIDRPSTGKEQSVEQATIRNCVSVFDEIHERSNGRQIVAKIDCEGSEYDIIDALCESGRIKKMSMLMIEWHSLLAGKTPEHLQETLTANGFTSVRSSQVQNTVGMLYAFRAEG